MNVPKVSVIMPVYNTEKYVAEAIESVLVQTLVDWELIIVNDGSTDNSLQIVEVFAKLDKRITIVSQENGGLSEARNTGLNLAKGEYIYFLDSDDEIIPNALAQCVDQCDHLLLDFLFFDAKTKYEMGANIANSNFEYLRTITIPDTVSNGLSSICDLLTNNEYFSSACLIFIRHSYIKENNFSFLKGILHEDELFTTSLFLYANKVMYLPMQLFIRRLRSNSIMTSSISRRNVDSYFVVASKLKNLVQYTPTFKQAVDLYLTKTLNAVLWKAHRLSLKDRLSIFGIVRKEWSSYIDLKTYIILLVKKYLPA